MNFLSSALGIAMILCSAALAASGQWIKQNVDTTASLRGLSVVNENVIWASGTGGTVIRTIDGGKSWNVMTVPGGEKLDFRDIEAFDADTAYILSIGNGESSRIYKTTNGGKSWTEEFRNKDAKAFYDAIACWDRKNCIAMSDPVDNKFPLIETKNGGKTWHQMDSTRLPTKDGEAAFAASGTCLLARAGLNNIWLVSGGTGARVFTRYTSIDAGYFWRVSDTPLGKGTSGTGIFSIAMWDVWNGVIVGGNYEKPDDAKNNLAMTTDGKTWVPATGLTGYRSAVTYIDSDTIIAVGTNGSDISRDRGKTWAVLGKEDLNAVAARDTYMRKGKYGVWAVGPKGGVYNLK